MPSRIDIGPDAGPFVELDEENGELVIRVPEDEVNFDQSDLRNVKDFTAGSVSTDELNNAIYVSTGDDLSTIASNASDATLVILPGSHEAEGLPIKSDIAYIGSPGATLSLPDNPSTHLFVASSGATVEGLSIKNLELDGGGTTTYDGLHIDDADRLEKATIENNYVHHFRRGYSGSANDRKPDLANNKWWDNEVGIYVNGNHPVMLQNDIRRNDVGLGGDLNDVQSTSDKYPFNRIGIQGLDGGKVTNCQFDNCHFYRNEEMHAQLDNNSRIDGGMLVPGDSTDDVGFVATGPGVTISNVTMRTDVDTTFDEAAIRLEDQSCSVRNCDALQIGTLVTGGGDNNLRGIKISDNEQVIDNTETQLVNGTAGTGAWLVPEITDNWVRSFVDPNNPIVYLPDDAGAGLGFVLTSNVIYGESGASGDYIAGEAGNAVIHGNRAHRITGQTLSGTPGINDDITTS